MSASRSVPLHKGRHRAIRPDQVGRALRRALVATMAPAVVLAVAGWIAVRTSSGRMLDLFLDPSALLWIIVAIVAVWALWIALICRTYARHRVHTASVPLRVLGAVGVAIMCGAVTAPMAVGARYAVVQRDLIGSVFGDEVSATAPKVTKANPWGKRDR
ncbi:MAG: hypothetical protein ACJ76Q_05470, partial [Solirubrobacteraceae bacterium]